MHYPPMTPLNTMTNEGPPSLAPVAWPEDPPVLPLNAPPPWWTWLIGAGATLAVLVSIGIAALDTPPASAATPAVTAVAPQEPEDDVDLHSLALEGEAPALARLEAMPAELRGVADVLVLTEGRRARDLREVQALVQRGGWELDEPARLRILGHARRADTGPETLGVLAASGGSVGADLIFAVWRSSPKGSSLSVTAAQLLVSPTVREQSSAALRIAIDVQRVEDCGTAAELVQEAERVADRRALRGLARLTRRVGCGSDGRADCFACLRPSADLARALRGASRRAEPRW